MNHNCNGEYFTAEDERLYRCDRDGQLTDAPVPFIYCPACGRRVDAVDRGNVQVLTVTVITRFAVQPDGREIKLDELKREEWK